MNAKFLHAAVACSSRQNSRRFFSDLLGLKLAKAYDAPAPLMKQLFGIDRDVKVEVYACGDAAIEAFILPGAPVPPPPAHVCAAVGDKAAFLSKCRKAGLPMVEAQKGDSVVTFVQDFDGNRYEIKQLPS